jgi:hypothetical protein
VVKVPRESKVVFPFITAIEEAVICMHELLMTLEEVINLVIYLRKEPLTKCVLRL